MRNVPVGPPTRLPLVRRAFAAVLILASLAVQAGPAVARDPLFGRQPDDPIVQARQRREALEKQISGQKDKLAALDAIGQRLDAAIAKTDDSLAGMAVDLEQLRADIADTEQQLLAAEAQRDDLQQQVETLDWSLDALTEQADELALDLDQRRRELGARLAEAYRAGKPSLWEQVLSASSLLDSVIQQQGALSLGEHDQELAQSIQEDQALLDEQRLELHHLRYDTESLRAEVAARAVAISVDRDKLVLAQKRLAELEAQTEALRAQQAEHYAGVVANQQLTAQIIRQQKQESEDLSKRINVLLTKERHSGRLPSAFNGTFRWPISGDISGMITQEFGCTGFFLEPPYGNCAHFHKGIDIAAPDGTPIVAAGDGVVLFVGWDPDAPREDASYSVVIAHSQHLVTYYGHLQPRRVHGLSAGVRVRAGQRIGWEGNTGNSTGPHLHWGVLLDGAPKNPRFFL